MVFECAGELCAHTMGLQKNPTGTTGSFPRIDSTATFYFADPHSGIIACRTFLAIVRAAQHKVRAIEMECTLMRMIIW